MVMAWGYTTNAKPGPGRQAKNKKSHDWDDRGVRFHRYRHTGRAEDLEQSGLHMKGSSLQ